MQPDEESQLPQHTAPPSPRIEASSRHICIHIAHVRLADTYHALRVIPAKQPPIYYIPQADIQMQYLAANPLPFFCEWEGILKYWTVKIGRRIETNSAWSYTHPLPDYAAIKDYIAFYPAAMDQCFIDDELVIVSEANRHLRGWQTAAKQK